MPKFPRLDDYCTKILASLIILGKKKRFNDLHDFLGENGIELTKPTLSQHLKHLTQAKLVIRKVEDVQQVSYEANHKRFRTLGENMKAASERRFKFQRFMADEEQAFKSASLDDQLEYVFETMILRNLRQLKTKIEFESNPVKKWEKSMELAFLTSPLFMQYEKWLILKCKEDKEYREKILQEIEVLIKKTEAS